MTTPVIECRNLQKWYSGVHALKALLERCHRRLEEACDALGPAPAQVPRPHGGAASGVGGV